MDDITFVGLDVHKATICMAVAEGTRGGEVRQLGVFENRPEILRKVVSRLSKGGRRLSFCYEAGPCGYGLHRLLTGYGHECVVVAPSLIPMKAGDRVKTDRRDALMLAKLHRAGELTPIWIADPAHEAMRSSKVIDLEMFVPRGEFDPVYFNTPYYLYPDGQMALEAVRVIGAAMADAGVIGIGHLTLSRRERVVMVEPRGTGMVLVTLRAADEVRAPQFATPDGAIDAE